MRKILGILGPTGVGKSQVGMLLAQKLGVDLISADSAQIYIGMDIGTAKPDKEEQKRVRHRLIDIVQPDDESFNAYLYAEAAEAAMEENPEKQPLLVGGTGLYFETLIYGLDFQVNEETFSVRKELKQYLVQNGEDALYEMLLNADPESAKSIHKHNVKGVMRALEIYRTGGQKKSQASPADRKPKRDFKFYVINEQREKLYDSINRRVDTMVDKGLFEEVENLLNRFPAHCRGFSAIGYKEIVDYFSGGCSKDDAIMLIKQHTRNYAKRQLTFFRRLPAVWLEKCETEKMCDMISEDFYDRKSLR